MGFEIVDIECRTGGRHGLLRLYIDSPHGVTVDDCGRVSEQVSGVLDVEDPIRGTYTLEVSSPGFDRILRKRAHFEAFAGHRLRVSLREPRDGRRRYTGTLIGLEADDLVIEVDGETVRLPLAAVDRARLAPEA